jgi:hypothetical protein
LEENVAAPVKKTETNDREDPLRNLHPLASDFITSGNVFTRLS